MPVHIDRIFILPKKVFVFPFEKIGVLFLGTTIVILASDILERKFPKWPWHIFLQASTFNVTAPEVSPRPLCKSSFIHHHYLSSRIVTCRCSL